MQYFPIDRSLLKETDDGQLFQNVAFHFLAVADNDYGRIDLVVGSHSARLVWCLWGFFPEVASNGINIYLWNHCHSLKDLQEVHSALQAVGESEVQKLLEGAVAYSLPAKSSEFLDEEGAVAWAAQFNMQDGWNPARTDLLSMEAVERASRQVAQYIRGNAHNL